MYNLYIILQVNYIYTFIFYIIYIFHFIFIKNHYHIIKIKNILFKN